MSGHLPMQSEVHETLRHAGLQLSVIIADSGVSTQIERCLRTLVTQARVVQAEIIVVHRTQDTLMTMVKAAYPEVTFVGPSKQANLPALLGEGIARSSGQIIAITDTSCVIDDHWLTSIVEAHRSECPVVGGAVEPASFGKLLDWAAYFCDYGQFMRPFREGPAAEMPGNNLSFKRWALGRCNPDGADVAMNFWKSQWCSGLRQKGFELLLTPTVVLRTERTHRLLPFLRRRFHHGRCFAGMRLAQTTSRRRAFYVMGSAVLPFLFLARLVQRITPKRRHMRKFILAFPLIAVAVTCWSAGEFYGYLRGPGHSCAQVY